MTDNSSVARPAVVYEKRGDVALAIIDHPPVNALSLAVRKGLLEALDSAARDDGVRAVVILCRGKTFVAGADIKEFGRPMEPPFFGEVIDRLDAFAKPVIAAIHGNALGGGLELALACHWRIAAPSARVGLPEVKLGTLPGAGGTQRLPRLVGLELALKMIVEGRPIGAAEALKNGAIDAIASGDLEADAIAFAREALSRENPLRRARDVTVAPDPILFERAEADARKRQRGAEAPLKCIEAVRLATELPFDEAAKREYALCIALLQSPQSKALRHIFAAEREVAKPPAAMAGAAPRPVKTAAVIGPGVMGAGIAICLLDAGFPVSLLGRSSASLESARARIGKIYDSGVTRGTLTAEQKADRLGRLKTTQSYDDLGDADLIIEAVDEDMAVKREVFRALDRVAKRGAVIATNTSFLDVDALARETGRPGDVAGMHFFNPANVMRLLENVRGAQTSDDVAATLMDVGKRLGKTSVLIGACEGFVGNRMLSKRSREALFMMEEGATPWRIDKALYDFGFPLGPHALADMAGLDIVLATRRARYDRLTPRERACDIIEQLVARGRLGQKSGAGYYKYDANRKSSPDPEVEQLLRDHAKARGIVPRAFDDAEIVERCVYAMVNEGAKLIEEGVVRRPHEIDIVWTHGFGFPAHKGGPMFYADQIGLPRVRDALRRYATTVGAEYFEPSPLIVRLADKGAGFYSNG
ncbi:MAG: 3-hydroxyacyl-CoA dehydrogenase [Rhizobiales bacterium 65-9]|nr:enoyl-CoA hydratase/isomerase family protein [Hyphomicrobiales bacterium]OJY39786.1 MAG: 3-hydroxyacyl-CoA dehydrogenase [Rhizobiales bacterium 65-9]